MCRFFPFTHWASKLIDVNWFYRPIAFDFLTKVLASANSYSSLFNERVVAALLRLLVVVIQYDELRDSTFLALDMLRSLSPAVLASVAEPLMEGLSKLFVENAGQIRWVSVSFCVLFIQ